MVFLPPQKKEPAYRPDGSIAIRITYDETIQNLTGVAEDISYASPGAPFLMVFNSILFEHPEIRKKFPPGVLGIELNGGRPDVDTLLKDGDRIHLLIPSPPRGTKKRPRK
ncbi:MAG: hypothetical protein A3G34_01790 [Candidatus Lindowbacteria bacterium RIFCSPLOWO2_12_FULL_62_27]|nr:MAG: hypothetical protein A3G34_01790 [Candidatus Lindowbacteria bacterium RIFCSPLOWO2_12_FULL_62_27]